MNTVRITKNRKVLLENFFFLCVLQIMRYLVPILVLPYVSRVIGLVHFGEIAVTASVTMIIQIIVEYGYNYIGAKDVAKNKNNFVFISDLYSSITIARITLFSFCYIIVSILTFFIPVLENVRLLLLITCPNVLLYVLMPEWLYQGLEEMKFITIIHVVSRIAYLALIFTLIRQPEDYIFYPIVNGIGFLTANIASFTILRRKKIYLHFVSPEKLWQMLQRGWDLFVNSICGGMLGSLLGIFIGNNLSIRDAGIYNASSRLIGAASHGMNIVSRVFFPFLAQHIEKHTKFFILNTLIALSLALFTFFCAPFLFHIFYPSEFSEGILIMRIMAIGLFFSCVNNSLSANYLILLGKEKLVRNMGLINLIFGLSLYLLAIKFYGLLGVAIIGVAISMLNTMVFSIYTIIIKRQRSKQSIILTSC